MYVCLYACMHVCVYAHAKVVNAFTASQEAGVHELRLSARMRLQRFSSGLKLLVYDSSEVGSY